MTDAARPLFSAALFRAEREADWARLETLLDRVEKGSARRLSDDDLTDLPRLYRATLSALSIARETSLDAALIAYLESLSRRAYFILYSAREPWEAKLRSFAARGLPGAVRAIVPETLVVALLFFASALGGYFLVTADPEWFGGIVSADMASGRDMEASADYLRSTLYDPPEGGGLEVFATMLFTNNAGVAILAFALGFAFGVPTLLLIAANGALIGAFYAAFVPHGLGPNLTGWLMIHGTTEILAIILSGAAGLHIGRAVAFPGDRTRMAAASDAGRRSAKVMIGVVAMMVVAGLLEGFGRQLISQDLPRYAVGIVMFAFWTVYFYGQRSARDHG